MFIKNGLSKVS